MSYGLLSLGIQGTRAAQSGLAVVGNNITNVNTEGYSRQIANFNSVEGGGVVQDPVQRIVDQYVNARLWADNSRFEAAQAYEQLASQLDNLMGSDSSSVAVKMDDYFSALQAASDDPTSLTSRELFLAEADALVRRYHDLYDQMVSMNDSLNTRIDEVATQINVYAGQIADLNDRIRIAETAGKDAFELQDQRDQSIKALSALVDVQVNEASNGELSIFVGNGQPLVVGQSSYTFSAFPNEFDPSRSEVGVTIAGRQGAVTDEISGGELGGLLTYREETMDRTLNELGRLAIVFADSMNAQHELGMDYDGDMGQLLFRDVNDPLLTSSRVRSRYSDGDVYITDASKLQASEYELVFTGTDSFRLTRLSDGQIWTQNSFTEVNAPATVDEEGELLFNSATGQLSLQIDGFRLDADGSGPFASNEKFQISPVRTAADDIEVNITDGRDLALAAPLTVTPASANGSSATAEIRIAAVDDSFESDPAALFPDMPLSLVYDSAGVPQWSSSSAAWNVAISSDDPNLLTVTDVTTGRTVLEVELSGTPADGDTFTLAYNFDLSASGSKSNIGLSDNRNGLLLSDLMKQATSLDGSYQETYGRLVERVGTDTKVAQMDRAASEAVLNNTIAQRESISGVNLDEEAVKLIQYQQAYQASAQIISASQKIFDALLQAV